MPSTHSCLLFHAVFSTKDRARSLTPAWQDELHDYLGGCLRRLHASPIRIGGIEDHVHLFFGAKPTHAVADLIREVKKGSGAWLQDRRQRFQWQEGYGAFSVSRRAQDAVAAYIARQREHHAEQSFQEEYEMFLREAGIPFDERYLL